MKKILLLVMVIFFVIGCKSNEKVQISPKDSETDNSVITSPINPYNLDDYMFRNDIQYVDLRSSRFVLEEGYVAGFQFIPFYNIIASFSGEGTLFKMERKKDDDGNNVYAGQIGGFTALYEESESIIKSLFEEDKYIFLISQAGSESSYLINLLIQLGYDGNLLYNVGGVSNSEGVEGYRNIKDNKYYVQGCSGFNPVITYDFLTNLTPIQN